MRFSTKVLVQRSAELGRVTISIFVTLAFIKHEKFVSTQKYRATRTLARVELVKKFV